LQNGGEKRIQRSTYLFIEGNHMDFPELIKVGLVTATGRYLFTVARLIPNAVCRNFGRRLGSWFYRFDSRARRIALKNVIFAFQNELTEIQAEQLVQRNFQQWGMIGIEWTKKYRLEKILRQPKPEMLEVVGLENLKKVKEENEVTLLLGSHFGNFEFSNAYYGSRFNRLNFIVRAIDNPYLERKRISLNTRYNVGILYKKSGLKPAIKNLRKGQDLIIFPDQNANAKEGIESRFFGHRTHSFSILASLAAKYNYPILPMFCVRKNFSGIHQVTFLEPLAIHPYTTMEEIVQMQNDALETIIRAHPDHWLWMHRRWRFDHPEIYKGV
jgi:KDO2-lipid IV(A) lauroyltransferase